MRYDVGMNRIVFVGLGNVGAAYDGTRHNMGIEVVRAWVEKNEPGTVWQARPKYEAEVVEVRIDGGRVTCLFPLTMMNNSGRAVAAFCQYEAVAAAVVVLVHDELELPLGEVAVTAGGGARGHNGVRSVQAALDTQEIQRVRLGIGRPAEDMPVDRFVLSRFSVEEAAVREQLLRDGMAALDKIADG